MNLAVRIQHHPSRAALVAELLPHLHGLPDPAVITDPDPRARRPSSWRTHRACLESTPADATHLLVLQDDAWPCEDFAEKALEAIAEKPDRLIALFVPGVSYLTRQVNVARLRQQPWLELPRTSFVPLVGVVYPADHARRIPGFADARRIGPHRADDAVVATYARAHKLSAVATLPSLVEHRDEVPSTMRMPHGRARPHRVAAWFEGAAPGTSAVSV